MIAKIALAIAFVAPVCRSAKPLPVDGASAGNGSAFATSRQRLVSEPVLVLDAAEQPEEQQLNLGALIAIVSIMLVATLVALATFLDLSGKTASTKRGRPTLAFQLLMAFSACRSAAHIFQSSSKQTACDRGPRSARGCPSNNNTNTTTSTTNSGQLSWAELISCPTCGSPICDPRSRLSSFSDVSELSSQSASSVACLAAAKQHSAADRCTWWCLANEWRARQQVVGSQSIDSLHGLKFLSMVWIIAIHSYEFAYRWSFFSSPSWRDKVYRSLAIQLLANGTFACDTFFFASGFLLAYFTFQEAPNLQTSTRLDLEESLADTEEETRHRADNKQQQPPSAAEEATSKAPPSATATVNTKREQNTNETVKQSYGGGPCFKPSFYLSKQQQQATTTRSHHQANQRQSQTLLSCKQVLSNLLHRYIRMVPLMMAIIGLTCTLLRFLGSGPAWDKSTIMFDKWCRKNWWINGLFLHNFIDRENMCLSHSWYSAVDMQLFLVGQVIMFVLLRNRRLGLLLLLALILAGQLITGLLTLFYHLPAVPLIVGPSESLMNLYFGYVYIKPYCRASPYLVGMLLAYLMRTSSLGRVRLTQFQVTVGWSCAIGMALAILTAMQPAMNGHPLGELEAALYSALSRTLWACAIGWIVFACITNHGGPFAWLISLRAFGPPSRLTYPAFLVHPIVMAILYGSNGAQSGGQFSHQLMLYLIIGNVVITFAVAFVLSALVELPLLAIERTLKLSSGGKETCHSQRLSHPTKDTCCSKEERHG